MDIIVSVPDIAELPAHEMLSILRQGSVLRLPHLEGRLRQAQVRVAHFEARIHEIEQQTAQAYWRASAAKTFL